MNLLPVGDRDDSQLCQLTGVIRVQNNKYELAPCQRMASNTRQILLGHLESQQHLIHHLNQRKKMQNFPFLFFSGYQRYRAGEK